jgi:hypothetical protein
VSPSAEIVSVAPVAVGSPTIVLALAFSRPFPMILRFVASMPGCGSFTWIR